jgi:integrase
LTLRLTGPQHPPIPEQRVERVSRKSSPKAGRVVRYRLKDGTLRVKRYPPYQPKVEVATGDTLEHLIRAWERSPEWAKLAERTRAQYTTYTQHLASMLNVDARRISRRELLDLRNAVREARGDGAAVGFARVVSALFSWALDNEWIEHSPATRLHKGLAKGHLPAWSQTEADTAIRRLPEHLRRAVVLALYTGQRRGDLIAMQWSAYDGVKLRLTQEKTDRPLVIPALAELRAELDAWKRSASSTYILTNKFGRPWRDSNLSKQIGEALSGIPGFPVGRNIHGLRKLAAANLAEAGCTTKEIAAVTGHKTLAMVQLYTESADQERAAEAAVIKLAGRRR